MKAWQNRCGVLSVQEATQRLAVVVLGLLGNAGIRYPIEAVIRPRIHVKLDRHPGAAQSIRICHVFFEEEIQTARPRLLIPTMSPGHSEIMSLAVPT